MRRRAGFAAYLVAILKKNILEKKKSGWNQGGRFGREGISQGDFGGFRDIHGGFRDFVSGFRDVQGYFHAKAAARSRRQGSSKPQSTPGSGPWLPPTCRRCSNG
jgi:hypothetical protein